MAQAAVGDEQRGEDPTTNTLQTQIAALLGKASIFLPSATMHGQCHCLSAAHEAGGGDHL